jgi:starch synthase (maltosyl-transferring)
MDRHILIESIRPSVDNGRFPAKRIAGEPCVVEAIIFRDGHEMIRANLKWRRKQEKRFSLVPMKLVNPGLDTWGAEFIPEQPGRYVFTVESWTDRYGTWLEDLKKRVEGGYESVKSEVLEGIELIEEATLKMKGEIRLEIEGLILELQGAIGEPKRALALASSKRVLEQMGRFQPRLDRVTHTPGLEILANCRNARFSAWYELFVRSQGREQGKSGTFQDAERRLPDIKKMGFNVVYLTPIHPIGKTKRKGRNNSLRAGQNDPGSPWAIGSEDGGHKAIEPSLGTIREFDRFVKKARELDMEVALDFAIQASPDHPWVEEHPEWFYHRPDGSIKYAENPPKKYEDIYPVNFDTTDRDGLWKELYNTIHFWVEHGVKIFRVDNRIPNLSISGGG